MARRKEEYVAYRLKQADEMLADADVLASAESWTSAANRLYYACFQATLALLIHHDLRTKTHSGTIRLLAQHFVKSGKLSREIAVTLSDLFDLRNEADYGEFVQITEEQILSMKPRAGQFVAGIKSLLDRENQAGATAK